MDSMKKSILLVFGTRPEALKLAPLILKAPQYRGLKVWTCLTGQHREMVDQVMRLFRIKADFDLDVMRPNQTLSELTQRLFPAMENSARLLNSHWILVSNSPTKRSCVMGSSSQR